MHGVTCKPLVHKLSVLLRTPPYTCLVCFESEEYGEFVYEVRGEVELPDPLGVIKLQATSNENVVKDFPVTFNNPMLENARRNYLEKHPLARQKKVAERLRKNF